MTGKEAYEVELKARPNYETGSPRPTWDKLSEIAKYSWNKNPTPRFIKD